METLSNFLKSDKFAEILNEVSRSFRRPLLFRRIDGGAFCGVGMETGETPCLAEGWTAPAKDDNERPISYNGEIIGTIRTAASVENMEAMAFCIENSLRLEMENLDLSAEIVRIYEDQAMIYSLSGKLGSEMDVESICRHILEEADKVLGARNISIMLLDPANNELYTGLCKGIDREAASSFRTDAVQGLIGRAFQIGEPLTICDVGAEGEQAFPYPVRSILCVPLVTDDRGLGMLVASDKLSGEEFWSRELKLMRVFALEAASTIRKAQLYEEIGALFIHTVKALATAIDAKDPYTYGHSRRVAGFTVAICKEMGMGRKEVRQAELAAILHDIGKIGIPESILQKPERLTSDEMLKMREHPEKGAHILANIVELQEVINWIKHHHERYDGSGYPDGLRGEDIPLQARVMAIADSFDAMTSDRPYRKGKPPKEVIRIMDEFAGSQFDPDLFSVFRTVCEAGLINPYLEGRGMPKLQTG
jgi:putative nucleotidyltransferase with HDIG domain